MPNIIMVGFDAAASQKLEKEMTKVMKSLGLDGDSVVTHMTSWVYRCSDGKSEPYAIVRSDNQEELDRVAVAVNERTGLGVEKELIQSFLPPNPGSFWYQEGR